MRICQHIPCTKPIPRTAPPRQMCCSYTCANLARAYVPTPEEAMAKAMRGALYCDPYRLKRDIKFMEREWGLT